MSKYHNIHVAAYGQVFDSKTELAYYKYLLTLKVAGVVRSIKRQVPFVLQDAFVHKATGKRIRAIKYVADFVVSYQKNTEQKAHTVVVDVKGSKKTLTQTFKLKHKMFLHRYPNKVFVVIIPKRGGWAEI